jgi:hypothetical protein
VHCLQVEKLGVPTAPVITTGFTSLVKSRAFKAGMPLMRFTFVPHPVAGREASVHREYLKGNDPTTGKPVMTEIIEALTKSLSEEEKKGGLLERPVPRTEGPDTEENLHRLFLGKGWTDGLPIVLPTEERVKQMLKGTSHRPDEIVGKMRPSPPHEDWEYTVEKVAVNAVMAGAKPEYLPVILAIASTGISSFHSSTTSFGKMVVVNGPISKKIGMNSGIGAMGPFNHANATIGRAWTLLSRNLGGAGVPGETYLGTVGNGLNYNNVCFAENEEKSPWEPFHVQKGFKPEESAVSLFSGWGFTRFLTMVAPEEWKYQVIRIAEGIPPASSQRLILLIDPMVARDFKAEGLDTKRRIAQWISENAKMPVGRFWGYNLAFTFMKPLGDKGIEPYATWLKLPYDTLIPMYPNPDDINTIVVGGETNANGFFGDFAYDKSASIDKWK